NFEHKLLSSIFGRHATRRALLTGHRIHMAKYIPEPIHYRVRQRRPGEGFDIGLQMRRVARAGKYDMRARFVAAEAISHIRHIDTAAAADGKAEWVIEVDVCRVDLSPFDQLDRKSTRLNSSHVKISYAVFCLKKKSK